MRDIMPRLRDPVIRVYDRTGRRVVCVIGYNHYQAGASHRTAIYASRTLACLVNLALCAGEYRLVLA